MGQIPQVRPLRHQIHHRQPHNPLQLWVGAFPGPWVASRACASRQLQTLWCAQAHQGQAGAQWDGSPLQLGKA